MAKPADFYVGVVDMFSIMLPGAAVSWAVWKWFGQQSEYADLVPPGEVAPWVAFALTAYAFGHIVFMLASFVDLSFEEFRDKLLLPSLGKDRRTLETNAREAAGALRLVSLSMDLHTPPKNVGDEKIKERFKDWAQAVLGKQDAGPTVPELTNAYQWSRAVLRLYAPASLAEVQRLEADSKFFRSLFILFVLLAAFSIVRAPGPEKLLLPHALTIPLAVLSYWRYGEQRQKGTVEAYRSVIVLFAMDRTPSQTARKDEPSDE